MTGTQPSRKYGSDKGIPSPSLKDPPALFDSCGKNWIRGFALGKESFDRCVGVANGFPSIRCSRTTGPLTTKARVASGGSGSGESSVGELSLPTKHLLRSNLDPHYRGHAILELPDVTSSR